MASSLDVHKVLIFIYENVKVLHPILEWEQSLDKLIEGEGHLEHDKVGGYAPLTKMSDHSIVFSSQLIGLLTHQEDTLNDHLQTL